MQELYGTRWGFKHSESLKREMRKDTVFMILLLVTGFWMVLESREKDYKMKSDWNVYVYHDMNKVRPIPDHVKDMQ